MKPNAAYWFPAKRYGWGWGLPLTWQGWVVLAVFFALVLTGGFLFPPRKALAAYISFVVVLAALLVGVCWLTGEPPRWRWGDDDRDGSANIR
jgi:hypothetical protein